MLHFSSFVCQDSLVSYQFLFWEWVELHTVLMTEITRKSTCFNSLQGLPSATLYLIDYPFCCNWWNFILFNGWVIILLKIYKHAFLLIKYPCFTRDLGPPRPSFCLWIVLQSVESYRSHFLAQLGFQDLLERTLWASVSGVSPMYGLYWFST